MAPPNNAIYILQGEINLVVTAMRRNSRWTSHTHQNDEHDPLLSTFSQLKDVLNSIVDLEELDPNTYLSPFLEVIRSEDTTGPITGLALTSINKFLSYGLVDPYCDSVATAVENIADAVTHAHFVGTDPSSDEVVLMKILHVLRTLLLSPAGIQLTNESVCEIMQSCFRICFETRLSDLLRKAAEHTLMDMVQLLFSRLPQFKEDPKWTATMKKLKMRAGGVDPSRVSKKKRSPKPRTKKSHAPSPVAEEPPSDVTSEPTGLVKTESLSDMTASNPDISFDDSIIATTPVAPRDEVMYIESFQHAAEKDQQERAESDLNFSQEDVRECNTSTDQTQQHTDHMSDSTGEPPGGEIDDEARQGRPPVEEIEDSEIQSDQQQRWPSENHFALTIPESKRNLSKASSETELNLEIDRSSVASEQAEDNESVQSAADHSDTASIPEAEYVSSRGVRFTHHHGPKEGSGPLIPYGLPCVRELFRFLVSVTNSIDRHNTDMMIHMGLSLLAVGLESGADHVGSFNSLLYLVRDEMCRNLFLLMQSERLSLFAAAIRVCFLLFEALRSHLKFQMENYLVKLSDIIVSESPKVSYEMREIALESVVQIWRVPGLVTELFLNYDCDIYCSNVFDDFTKLLSKNAFPVSGLFTTHLLSLDALLTVVDSIEQHCHSRILNANKSISDDRVKIADHMAEQADMEYMGAVEKSTVPPPITTGCVIAQQLLQGKEGAELYNHLPKMKEMKRGPQIKPNRMKITARIPSEEDLAAIRNRKRLLQAGTEQFNQKPSKGIAFLQEQGLLSTPLDPMEIVTFLKENPRVDKAMIGEYLSNKKNAVVLEAFVRSFHFYDTRLDEALRVYLETFRLPGESPLIEHLMEHFANWWHKANGEPFVNVDAAFTLSYAVIMLNTDQHNHNVRKQNVPMTVEEFKRNCARTNGGEDFDGDLLEEIYVAIKNDEIVMPSEQAGLVRENFLWKGLLRRGGTKEAVYVHAPTGSFDHDLFTLIWGPTVAALSFVFDKSADETIIQKAISGFRKCAMISAHYGMSDVFDNLVISLCKFTTLLSSAEAPDAIPISFGSNMKAQLAAKTVFGLAHRHGDILREGWKNILDCMLQLYKAKLLPKVLTEVEDFVEPTGRISIIKEENTAAQRSETGVFSSFVSIFSLSDSTNPKAPSQEEQDAIRNADDCIKECHLEQLVQESKFLREESLQELVKALIFASQGPENQVSMGLGYDEDAAVFFLEMLVKVILQNRDRVSPVWQGVRDHLYTLIVNASEHTFLAERAVVGLLRLAIRLLRREEIASQVLTSLRILLIAKPLVIHSISRQVSFGLHDLLRTNAANIHSAQDWSTLFLLLEVVGAGANPPPLLQVASGVNVPDTISDADPAGAQSDSEVQMESMNTSEIIERGYTSDPELYDCESHGIHSPKNRAHPEMEVKSLADHGSWLLVNQDEIVASLAPLSSSLTTPSNVTMLHNGSTTITNDTSSSRGILKKPVFNQYSISLNEEIQYCEARSLLKSCETLAFLVRDAAHITPHNFESCVHSVRAFVEASLNGGRQKNSVRPVQRPKKLTHHKSKRKNMKKSQSIPSYLVHAHASGSDEEMEGGIESTAAALHSLSIQLLDLMHTLHTRAASIFSSWAEEEEKQHSDSRDGIDAGTSTLWAKCWCPLLQGIARLCCDTRRQVRSQALTYLQRALLVHDLQTLSAVEWEACFNKVLFPLLTQLLTNINPYDPTGLEETRMRASTLLCKVFLQHLSPLLSLSTFTALWLTILEFMDKYMHMDRSDLLCEAIPESLKNMLLVMDTASIFQTGDGAESQLWRLTWDRIDTFLPHLKKELFKPRQPSTHSVTHGEVVQKQPSVKTPDGAQPASAHSTQLHMNGTGGAPGDAAATVKETADIAVSTTPPRPSSPLAVENNATPVSTYILHPPLPSNIALTTHSISTMTPAVPLLLNPDIMQGTNIPFLSPQGTPERQSTIVTMESKS